MFTWFLEPKHRVYIGFQFVSIAVALVLFGLDIFAKWLPPPGVAVAIVAVVAAGMSLHPEMRGSHKAIWMLTIGAFLFLEFLAIGREATDQREAAMLNQQRFEVTINTATGGDSFAIAWPIIRVENISIVILQKGKFPISDLSVRMADEEALLHNYNLPYTGIGTLATDDYRPLVRFGMPNSSEKRFIASFRARNGAWDELMLFRKDQGGSWHFATRVYRHKGQLAFAELKQQTRDALIFEWTDREFPGDSVADAVWDSFNGQERYCTDCK